jgi:hypothetical protein
MQDTTLMVNHDRELKHHGNSPEQKQRAALAVADIAHRAHPDNDDAARDAAYTVLDILDLLPAPTPGARRRRKGLGAPYAERTVPRGITPSSVQCGSAPGAQAHHRADEPLCDTCQAWSDERHRMTRTPPGSRCGTPTGAQMHRGLGEKVCERCKAAESEKSAARYAATHVPSDRAPGRPRKHAIDRPATARERTVLLLVDLHGIAPVDGQYRTTAGDDVTAAALGCAKAGWLELGGDVPALTDAGRAELHRDRTTKAA